MNKIGWCSMTWNPVWGCLNHCEYCYARKIAKRFASQIALRECYFNLNDLRTRTYVNIANKIENFEPIFLGHQFDKKFPKKPQRIFVGSMSEIYYWPEDLMEKVLEKVKQYPQHIFQFLTKNSEVYQKYNFPDNCWLGLTIADSKYFNFNDYQKFKMSHPNNLKFVSYEPLLDEIFVNLEGIGWVIIGAEAGNRKGKVILKKEWIEDIVDYCRNNNIPIYLKDSLKDIFPEEIKDFPII